MKGMTILFIKSIFLILAMIVVSVIIGQILLTILPRRVETETTRFRKEASRILDTLVTSESCLAVREGEKIIDLNALDDFQSKYPDIEPDCARSYDYGYYVKVEMSEIKRREWYFGSRNHSEYDALKGSVRLSIPVMIKISENRVQSGLITIKLYKGELEELVGLIDKTCDNGLEIVKSINLSYPVELKGNSVCMKAREEFCRKFACGLSVEFDGISSPGTYTFHSRREDNIIYLSIE